MGDLKMNLMNIFLYYSISSDFTKDEIIEIDKRVVKNRKAVGLLVKKIIVSWQFVQSAAQPVASVVMPLPPITIHRQTPVEEIDRLSIGIADLPLPKVDKIRLTSEQIEQFNNLAIQLNNGTITMKEAVLRLRGGDRGVKDAVVIIGFFIFINWYGSLHGTRALQVPPLPHQDPIGWLNGKYNSQNTGNGRCLSHPPSRFERDTLYKINQMCAASADENGFIMTYEEAYNLVKETYSGSLQVTEECRISSWQSAKKSYHFQKGFGIDLDKYPNITKDDLVTLQHSDGGLIPYVQRGGKLPPVELINDCKHKIYDFCHLENTEVNRGAIHYGKNTGETPSIMFFNRETNQIALFNKTSGDLITADKFRDKYFKQCVDSGQVGKPKN